MNTGMNRSGAAAASGFDDFISFDLETTGLDSKTDEIIEIALVRVEGGRIVERLGGLVRPSVSIPHTVTRLTGIRDEDCADQPPIAERLSGLVEWMADRWIVAHNPDFDLSFFNAALEKLGPVPDFASRALDTVELSRMLLPWLPNHRLATVAEACGVAVETSHRALADAEATALAFVALSRFARGLDPIILRRARRFVSGSSPALVTFFESMEKTGLPESRPRPAVPVNILGSRPDPGEPGKPVTVEDVRHAFSQEGPISAALSKYETRTPQIDMAAAVSQALERDEFLIAEAGTGVGKSLAYLLPAILWAQTDPERRVVISTHTKTLQDQLFSQELPLLARTLGDPFMAALLKGRSNYLCLQRYRRLAEEGWDMIPPASRRKLLPLALWAEETATGDIDENPGFMAAASDQWSGLNADNAACEGMRCEHESECFLQRIRRAAKYAQAVLVNHALLFSDLVAERAVLGDYDTLVVDEAHLVEKTASSHLGATLTLGEFRRLAGLLATPGRDRSGLLNRIRHHLAGIENSLGLDPLTSSLVQESGRIEPAARRFFSGLDRLFEGKPPYQNKQRIRDAAAFFEPFEPEIEEIKGILDMVTAGLFRLAERLRGEPGWEEETAETDARFRDCGLLVATIDGFVRNACTDDVLWCESAFRDDQHARLSMSPIEVGVRLSDALWKRLERCVLTSATLAVGGKFEYVSGRLGLNRIEPERLTTRLFGSPYDFNEQLKLLVPTFLPNPKEPIFAARSAGLIREVLTNHPRGALVLFTSHAMLREVYAAVRPDLEALGTPVLGQGIDGSFGMLARLFRDEERSVLLGTNSFWEGVDFPGSTLELLVITKIPFDVPTDPVIEARMELAQRNGGSGFMDFVVPEAIVRFRQGFGRLIRARTDRGAVLVLDKRIVQSEYGRMFRDSLPVNAVTCDSPARVMSLLDEWFKET